MKDDSDNAAAAGFCVGGDFVAYRSCCAVFDYFKGAHSQAHDAYFEGESLLNDATGLVCFQFAVAAVLTGHFSLATASLTFVWVLVVGLSLGIATTYVLSRVQRWVWRHFGGEPAAAILFNLLTPFAAYLLAESMQASGILAAVAAGITMSYVELSGNAQATIRVQRWAVWETVQFTFNGIIFVLLGEQLPGILDDLVHSAQQAGYMNVGWLLVDVAVISAGLMLLRFLWVWLSLQWNLFKAVCCGKQRISPPWQIVVAMSLSGVRGAVTLAGVLTLPLLMPDGTPLPARQLVIFWPPQSFWFRCYWRVWLYRICCVVWSFPRRVVMTRKRISRVEYRLRLHLRQWSGYVRGWLRIVLMLSATMRLLIRSANCINASLGPLIWPMSIHKKPRYSSRLYGAFVRWVWAAERDELFRLAREHNISDELLQRMVRNLDLIEARRRS